MNFIKTWFFYGLFILLIVLTGCFSFKPYENTNQPQSCNDKITYMQLMIKTNGLFNKDGTLAFLTLLTQADMQCKTDRKTFRRIKCYDDALKLIYDGKLISSNAEPKKYIEFKDLLDKCNAGKYNIK